MNRSRAVAVSASVVRPMRSRVLRPGQPPESLVYPGDDDPGTLHLVVPAGGTGGDGADEPLAIASLYLHPVPAASKERAGEAAVRLRGMATDPAHRGLGLGRVLVEHGMRMMQERLTEQTAAGTGKQTGGVIWCNARTPAAGYYERLGFWVVSDSFEIAGIGPHVVMLRDLPGKH